MAPARKRHRTSARLLLALCSTVLTVAALEVGVRTFAALFMEGRGFFREDRLVSPFFLTYDVPPPRIDAEGRAFFRHREEPVARQVAADTVRILAVGGSTTANARPFATAGVDYPSRLQALLNEAGGSPTYEVLNAGSDAFTTAHTLVNLQLRLLEFQPDVVLLMHNINDLSVNYTGTPVQPDYANKYLQPFHINPQLQAGRSLGGFLNQSRLLAATGWLPGLAHQAEVIDVDIGPGRRLFHRNLRHIAEVCGAAGVRLVLLSQPARMTARDFYDRDHFRAYNEEVRRCAELGAAEFVDLHAEFGHEPQHFIDEFHYTPEGIERLATILAGHLLAGHLGD